MVGCEHQREAAAHAEPDDAARPVQSFRPACARRIQVSERLRPITDVREETRSTGRPSRTDPAPEREILQTQATPFGGARSPSR